MTVTFQVPTWSVVILNTVVAELFEGTVTLGLVHEKPRPPGTPVAVRPTLPAKPFRLATVMVEFAVLLGWNTRVVGFAETAKSVTLTVTGADTDKEPLVIVTLTV